MVIFAKIMGYNMKKYAVAILLTASLVSCSENLTLISYNVGAFGKYSEDSSPAVAEFILQSGAVIAGLNELDSCNRRHAAYQLENLSSQLGGWDFHFAQAFPFAGGAYGNGIVSAKPVLAREHIDLPQLDGYEPRSVAVIETEDCVFASTHLDVGSASAKLEQARIINEWFQVHYNGFKKPVILCGDMNSTPESPTIKELEKCWTRLSGTGFTYSSEDPHTCIDYFFCLKDAKQVKVRSSEVIGVAEYPAVEDMSDHLPIILKIKY